MNVQRDFLLLVTWAVAITAPAWAQTATPTLGAANNAKPAAASISEFFRCMESSRLSVVRAARIGPRTDHQPVALAGAATRRCGRFGGFASKQGGYQQLRPTGR